MRERLDEVPFYFFRLPVGKRAPATPKHQGDELSVLDIQDGFIGMLYQKRFPVYVETAVFDF